MGLYDGYLYSRDGKLIPVDDTHHDFITKNPRYIFSPKEIEHLCDAYRVSSLKELSDTEEFQFEDGPIYNHFLKSVLKKGWLKIRNNQPSHTTYIVCYNYKRDYDTIMNFIEKCPELVENTLHIEAFSDKDYLTTEKRNVANDLFKMFEARVFPHSSGFGLSLYDDDDYEPTIINKVKYYPFSIEDDGEKYYFDKHGNSVKHIWNAICFGTKEDALDFGNEHLIFGELDVEEVTKTEQVLDESKVDLFNSLLEAIDDFPKNTRAMYRFAKRRHDDTKAIRKVSKEPYWVHPEGVAKIVMEHGGSDTQIKIAMAHDTLEDAGANYEDLVEKFGKEVADGIQALTNDNFKISKMGKEDYMTDKLLNLPEEYLFVKLADMAYNSSDMPNKAQLDRIIKNLETLYIKRDLGKQCESMLHYALDCAYNQRLSSNNSY